MQLHALLPFISGSGLHSNRNVCQALRTTFFAPEKTVVPSPDTLHRPVILCPSELLKVWFEDHRTDIDSSGPRNSHPFQLVSFLCSGRCSLWCSLPGRRTSPRPWR